MTVVIELNDLELSLYRGQDPLYRQPAFASARPDEVLFGDRAVRVARLHPQQANQQYLYRMNADPLPQPVRTAANHADLVYLHLKELAALCPEDAVLAVPGTMSGDQLGILLGICQEAGIEIGGFVNAAVAALTTTAAPPEVAYLDVFLQHVQVSELRVDDEVRHERSFEVRDCGFSALLDGWVNLIADRFVRETRFDPLHTAESEQQLYDQVYDWALGAHYRSEVAIEILHGDQRRRVELPATQLEQKAQQRVERLLDALPPGRALALSARTARLPGLVPHLAGTGHQITHLGADAVAAGCNRHMALIRTAESGLKLITRLPHEHAPTEVAAAPDLTPTHLLNDHVARPVSSAAPMLKLDQRDGSLQLNPGQGVTVNGQAPTDPVRLRLGDELQLGNRTYTAIRLEE